MATNHWRKPLWVHSRIERKRSDQLLDFFLSASNITAHSVSVISILVEGEEAETEVNFVEKAVHLTGSNEVQLVIAEARASLWKDRSLRQFKEKKVKEGRREKERAVCYGSGTFAGPSHPHPSSYTYALSPSSRSYFVLCANCVFSFQLPLIAMKTSGRWSCLLHLLVRKAGIKGKWKSMEGIKWRRERKNLSSTKWRSHWTMPFAHVWVGPVCALLWTVLVPCSSFCLPL